METPEFEVSVDLLNHLRRNPKSKRLEENIKFVFKKSIRFLQEIFRIKIYPGTTRFLKKKFRTLCPLKRFEYAFYGYYFGHAASRLNLPIENFFLPRHSKEYVGQKGKMIPKTVSLNFINLVKKSDLFVRDLEFYLSHGMIKEIRWNIVDKTKRMCMDWEAKLLEKNSKDLILWVKNYFENNAKCKLPWSSEEVRISIQSVMDILKKN